MENSDSQNTGRCVSCGTQEIDGSSNVCKKCRGLFDRLVARNGFAFAMGIMPGIKFGKEDTGEKIAPY
ncbi:MAG: hypothetical protein AAB581_04200 [Patescibacteria group bacterium]